MIDESRLKEVLAEYRQVFVSERWGRERYKWEAVRCFQDNWDIDAENFAEMLDNSLSKAGNLLTSAKNYPKGMIVGFAQAAPMEVRSMFAELFDETKDVYERVAAFKERSSVLLDKYGKDAKQHYQNENVISTYLWLRYPDTYYVYKFKVAKAVSNALDGERQFKKGAYIDNMRNFRAMYDEIHKNVQQDTDLARLFRDQLMDGCYPDPELRTLTADIGTYIFQQHARQDEAASVIQHEEKEGAGEQGYWWLNANPTIWRFANLPVGETQAYTLYTENGNKRRIFKNFLDAKVGDLIIGYETSPVKQIIALAKITKAHDGEKIYFEKTEGLENPIDYQTLRQCPELEEMEFFHNPNGSLFKLEKNEYETIVDLVREENPLHTGMDVPSYTKENFLSEVYMSQEKYDRLSGVLLHKKNIILQGAPGVGKTFAARRLAYSLMGKKDDSRIEFVQFHQNYSYEDFMMGYKPSENGFELKYGVFYRFCQKAANRPDKPFFFIIDEINRGNLSKIFGELLMLIENDYRGTKITLAYNGMPFAVPKNLYIIGMMNTADRSLAMIDYALRRRFSFFEIEPGFDSRGFQNYHRSLSNKTFDNLIAAIERLNEAISHDGTLGNGFRIGHSFFCGRNRESCTDDWMRSVIDYDIMPMLSEYWFDDEENVRRWDGILHGVFQ